MTGPSQLIEKYEKFTDPTFHAQFVLQSTIECLNVTTHIQVLFFFTLEGRDSSVGTATRYWLVGPGIESRWGEIFRTRPDRAWGPPSLLYNGYRVFPGGKAARAWR